MAKRTTKRSISRKVTSHKTNGNIRVPKTRIVSTTVSTLPAYKCKHCGYVSQPRVNNPKVCPHCHRFHWY